MGRGGGGGGKWNKKTVYVIAAGEQTIASSIDMTACFHCRRGFQCITPPEVLAINCSFMRETVRTSLRYVDTLAGRDY